MRASSREKIHRDPPSRKELTEDTSKYSSDIGVRGFYLLWPWILAAVVAGLYANSPSVDIGLITLCIGGMILFVPRESKTRAVDWSLLLILGFECVSVILSYYRPNSIRGFRATGIGALLFWAIRLTLLRDSPKVACFSAVVGFGGTLLALKGLRDFVYETIRLTAAGFSNLLPLRARLIAPGATWLPGEWFTILLLALAFSSVVPIFFRARARGWLTVFTFLPTLTITAALTLSLSRAAFWSTVLFYSSACVLLVVSKIVSFRAGGFVLAGTFGILVLALACESAIYPRLIDAYTGGQMSQTRSTQGRIGIWGRSLELVRAHAFMGIGSGNSALLLLSSADEEDTNGFASRTFSLPVQILVEKGIAGFLLYSIFLVFVAREFVKNIEKSTVKQDSAYTAMRCCFAAGLIAVLFRELTYSSLMEHSLTLALFAALAALVCRSEPVERVMDAA